MTNQLILLEPDLFDTGASTKASAPRSGSPLRPPRSSRRSDAVRIADDPNEYHLDEHTREVGRAGLAAARRALAEAVRRSEARAVVEPVAA